MALRYDFVQVSNPRIDSKTGILRCRGTIARTGIQDYRSSDGSIRKEFRPPDEVEKSAKSFEAQPITLNHPPEMVNSSNSRQYLRGLSGAVSFDGVLLTTDLTVTDQEAIDKAQTTHQQLSNGYECDIDDTPGVWKGEKYDCVQRNIRGNHVALVEKARAGDVAKLHFDGGDDLPDDCAIAIRLDQSDTEIKSLCVVDSIQGNTKAQQPLTQSRRSRMTTLRIDSVEYNDVADALAAQVSDKLKQLTAETSRADSAESDFEAAQVRIQELEDQLEDATDTKERERGRADQLEIQVEHLTYQVEDATTETKTDSEDDEPEARLDESDILRAISAGIEEGLYVRIDAYDVLEQHDIDLEDVDFAPEMTPAQVQERVLELVQPGVTFDSVDDSVRYVYVQARYDALKTSIPIEQVEERHDAEGFVAGARGAITSNRKKSAGGKGGAGELDEGCKAKMDAHNRPLSTSKRR